MACDKETTDLLCYVDGDMNLLNTVANFVIHSKFKNKRFIHRKKGLPSDNSIRLRRQRIADIHNELKELIGDVRAVFLLEDDTLISINTLQKLIETYYLKPHAGFISGVQVGRWGYTICGVWRVDNPYAITLIESLLPAEGVEEITSAGLYCSLTHKAMYQSVNFRPFYEILGPDVMFGIELRRQGYKNFVDWSIKTGHMTKKETLTVHNVQLQKIIFTRGENDSWVQEVVS